MYSEQLEQFIELILADGEITDKERAVLYKKAAAEGVDADEIDVYVDGKLDMLKKQVSCEQGESTPTKSIDESGMNMNVLTKQIDETNGRVIYRLRENYPLECISERSIVGYENPFLCIELIEEVDRAPFCMIRGGFVPSDKMFMGVFEEFTIRTNIGRFHASKPEGELFASMFVDGTMIRKLFAIKLIQGIKAHPHKLYKDGRYFVTDWCDYLPASNESFGDYVRKFYTAINGQNVLSDFMQGEQFMEDTISMENGISLLDSSPMSLKPTGNDTPFFEQYADEKTGTVVTHFNKTCDVRSRGDKLRVSLGIRLHALTDAEGKKTTYFLDVEKERFTECIKTKDRKGEEEEEWKDCEYSLGLEYSTLTINLGSEKAQLTPVTIDMPVRDDKEYCYYIVDSVLMKQLAVLEGFKLTLETKKGTFSLQPRIGFSKDISLHKFWKLGYKVLTQPDRREEILQEYNDNLFSTKAKKAADSFFNGLKGLFGKK